MFWKRKAMEPRVEVVDRNGLTITETVTGVLMYEYLHGGDFDVVIYLTGLTHWNPPYDHVALSEADRERLKPAIEKKFSGMRIEWQ